jgi:mRNA interferase RelE/StbE
MKLHYTNKASEQLQHLPFATEMRIREKLDFYLVQKDPLAFAQPLSGFPVYRYRIGDYRVIFKIEAGILFVLLIKKRDEIYKDL